MTPTDSEEPLPTSLMARLDRPSADRETTLAVVSDTHVHEDNESYLRRALADVDGRDVDALVHAGDLSGDGDPAEFDRFDALVEDLATPVYVVPGNHDLPKSFDDHPTLPFGEFESRYAPDGLPFVERIGGVDLIGLNSAGTDEFLSDTHDGKLPEAELEWLDSVLADAANPVIAVHHNLPAMMRQYETYRDEVLPEHDGSPPVMRDPSPFVDVLAAHDAPLVLTGHMHLPAVAEMRGTREVMCPSMRSFPLGYLLVRIGPEGTTVRFVNVATLDELETAYWERSRSKPNSAVLTGMAAARFASFPLLDER